MGKPSKTRLGYCWGVAVTAFGFVVFMLGSLLFAFLLFPLVRLWPGGRERKERRGMLALHRCFKLFLRSLEWLGGMRAVQVEGRENLKKDTPYIMIANHPCLLDIVAVVSELPDTSCIVKRSWWDHFFIGKVVRRIGYIPHDAGPALIESCRRVFAAGRSLILFPEGTRSPAHDLHSFNKGFAQIAMRCGVDVIPIVITCEPPTLRKDQRWYHVGRDTPFRLALKIMPPMQLPDELMQARSLRVKARSLTRRAELFFEEQLGPSRPAHSDNRATITTAQ